MFCEQCGAKYANTDKFCPECGARTFSRSAKQTGPVPDRYVQESNPRGPRLKVLFAFSILIILLSTATLGRELLDFYGSLQSSYPNQTPAMNIVPANTESPAGINQSASETTNSPGHSPSGHHSPQVPFTTITPSHAIDASPSPSAGVPHQVIIDNFIYINNREFEKAYELRSKNRKSLTSLATLKSWYKHNISIKAEEANTISINKNTAKVRAIILSRFRENGKAVSEKFNFTYFMVLEDGRWKIDDSKFKPVPGSKVFLDGNKSNAPEDALISADLKNCTVQSTIRAYFVITGCYKDSRDGKLEDNMQRLKAAGFKPEVLQSSDYAALKPGWTIVVAGRFDSLQKAERFAKQLNAQGFEAYAKRASI